MININQSLSETQLLPSVKQMFELSEKKIHLLRKSWDPAKGTPVFTREGRYTSRGWTEWTQGFLFGSPLLQYDATGEKEFLEYGREQTLRYMAPHVSHVGVHDHGFNNVSTYGTLLRLMNEGRIPESEWERRFYELALKVSGAIQASRWTSLPGDQGYIYSFNGPHSLFVDTLRSLRSLALSYRLGHRLMAEQDEAVNLLHRLLTHGETTARYNVYFGKGRDAFDVRGRVAHESIFNVTNGSYRCASTQQGYSAYTTWTRGLAWALLGYAEELEFLATISPGEFRPTWEKRKVMARFLETVRAVADYYIEEMPADGIPYWDTGAPGLAALGDYRAKPADPFNNHEPVDSSAAAIAAQGLIRLGRFLAGNGKKKEGQRYLRAGLVVTQALFREPYLSTDPRHEGLLLHSVYHRPHGWDYIPRGSSIPRGESSMWGDYHARELGLLVMRIAEGRPYYTFWHGSSKS